MSGTIRVTLPDGSVREVPTGTTAAADRRGDRRRAWRARPLAARVNGADLGPRPSARGRRHPRRSSPTGTPTRSRCCATPPPTSWPRRCASCFPSAGIGFGPPIEDGFYYDFEVDRPFTPEDLERIEAKMAEVAERATTRSCARWWTATEANRRFADDPLKLERISELGDDETITVYTDGPFQDLCRGPHIPRTGRLKHFKLLSAAGAYWRGDEHRQMLQRIYGTAWFKKDELDAYLHRLEEARKRDHRRLGKELDLFMFHPFAPGAPFYTDRGTTMVRVINDYIREPQPARRLPGDQDAAAVQQGAVGDLGPLGQVPGEHVPGARQRDRRARLLAQADELPVAPSATSAPGSTATASCRSATRPSTCCTGTRSPARSAGSPGCASSSRTTATST